MPTDKERREVAESLRYSAGRPATCTLRHTLLGSVNFGGEFPHNDPELLGMLADLIEPDESVVRCGECRFADDSYGPHHLICHRPMGYSGFAEVYADGYCSEGARRDGSYPIDTIGSDVKCVTPGSEACKERLPRYEIQGGANADADR